MARLSVLHALFALCTVIFAIPTGQPETWQLSHHGNALSPFIEKRQFPGDGLSSDLDPETTLVNGEMPSLDNLLTACNDLHWSPYRYSRCLSTIEKFLREYQQFDVPRPESEWTLSKLQAWTIAENHCRWFLVVNKEEYISCFQEIILFCPQSKIASLPDYAQCLSAMGYTTVPGDALETFMPGLPPELFEDPTTVGTPSLPDPAIPSEIQGQSLE